MQITTLNDINKLMSLISLNCLGNQIELLDVSDMTKLETLACQDNIISSLIVTNTPKLNILDCSHNNLVSIPTLTSVGALTLAEFTYNYMPIEETNRLISLGFLSYRVLPQN